MRPGGQSCALASFWWPAANLGDPNFAQAVVLLIHYDSEKGAMGLIVNRADGCSAFPCFEDLKEAKGRADPVYVGGPVESSNVLALLKSASKRTDAKHVFGDVYLVSSKTLLEKTLARKWNRTRFMCTSGTPGGARAIGARSGTGRLAHHGRRRWQCVSLRSRIGLASADSADGDAVASVSGRRSAIPLAAW